ncbi:MAG: hypothetical protein AAGJ35_11170 [Myxococcota bacterium]
MEMCRIWKLLGLVTVGFGLLLTACDNNPCLRYFQELKRRCRINVEGGVSSEGAKFDEYLTFPFNECQLEICARASIREINCDDAETHLPGGRSGGYARCPGPQTSSVGEQVRSSFPSPLSTQAEERTE